MLLLGIKLYELGFFKAEFTFKKNYINTFALKII